MQLNFAELSSVYFRSVKANFHSSGCDDQSDDGFVKVSLPSWTQTLNACIGLASQLNRASIENWPISLPTHLRPFEDVLIPFVIMALSRLEGDPEHRHFSKGSRISLARHLLNWLADLTALPLQLEFSAFRAGSWSGLNRAFASNETASSNGCYQNFIEQLKNGGLRNFFLRYSVLARLTATIIEQWICMFKNLMLRFEKDEHAVEEMFNGGKPVGQVTDIYATRSDRHYNGQSVLILEFDSGMRLVYKPKEIGLELAYQKLAHFLNEAGAPHPFKTFRVLTQEDYGWAEYVSSIPLDDRRSASAYYKNVGSLLCLAHVLGATDLHMENIIGNGEHPVLVDVETLMHPFGRRNCNASNNATVFAQRILSESVIRTGMLPRWNTDQPGQIYDVSAVGAGLQQDLQLEWLSWKKINTDDMYAVKEPMSMFPTAGKHSGKYSSTYYAAQMIAGFRDTYRFLMEQKDRLSVASCWNDLKNQNIRFVFRPTRAYASLHKNLLHPRLLKKGSDRSNYLNILSRESEEKVPIPDWRPLAVLERKFIEQMDVPHFTTRADSTSIPLNNGKEIAGYFEHSAFHNACLRLNGLNECDLERQVRFIEGALNCRSGSNSKHNNTEFSKRHGGMLTPEMALQQGKEIAKTLINSAIRADDGSITWIAPRPIGVSGKHQLDPISLDLYGGTAGIALFFAAMYRITLKDEYKDCVAGALKTVIDNAWKFQTTSDCASRNIGGFAGLGSLAYSLMQCGQLTGLSELKIAAEATAFRISHSIDYDRKFDLMYGAAGAILSLSKVHEHSGEPELLKAMTHAGHHLLQHRKRSDSGHWIWCGSEGNFLTGYSHGAAGIAQALVRLSAATGAKKFSDAAREAIDWENRSFHFAKTNWTDYRQPIENATEQSSRNRFMTAWCHGAAGIGLSRLEILKNISSTEIEHDVLRALATTRKVVNSKTDYLCCGNFGRLELLMNASQHLTDSSLAQEALKSAGMLLQRARASGGYRYHPAIGYTPGFFQGISGIGYQMLRMTHPELIPSVLTLS